MNLKLKNNLLVVALLCSATVFGQYLPERGETVHFSIGHNFLLNTPKELTQSWRSTGWKFQFMRETLFARKSHWGMGYGIGFSGNYWHTNLSVTTYPGSAPNGYNFMPTDTSYKQNKFAAHYFDIPFEFRYRSYSNMKGQYYRFYFGALAGIRMNSYSTYRDANYNVKYYKLNEVAHFQYGVFLRTGWWIYNFYAYYGLNSVFSKNPVSGPQDLNKMRSLTLGLSISL